MELEDSSKRTLAGVSEANLERYLQTRRGKQAKKPLKLSAAAKKALEGTQRLQATNDAICGAPALMEQPQEDEHGKSPPEGRSRVEDAPTANPFWPVRRGSEDEWEDDSGVSDGENGDAASLGVGEEVLGLLNMAKHVHSLQALTEEQQENRELLITLGKEDTTSLQLPKRKFDPEEIRAAAIGHQLHLLCLLARGRNFDAAASDPVIQALAVSCLPANVDASLQRIKSKHVKMADLKEVCDWFREKTCLQDSAPDAAVPEPQDTKESGKERVSRRLQLVASSKTGSPEELIALFVAVLRSHGLLTRFVRALDPLPWRPTLREKYVPRQQRAPGAAKTPSTGRAKRKRKSQKVEEADNNPEANDLEALPAPGEDDVATSKGQPEEKSKEKTKQGGKGRGRGRGRGKASGRGRGRGGSRTKKVDTDDDETDDRNEEDYKPVEASSDGDADFEEVATLRTTRARRKAGRKEIEAIDSTAEKSGKSEQGNEVDTTQEAPVPSKRQRKGDLEYENQIAMAMMASAAAQTKSSEAGGDPAAEKSSTKTKTWRRDLWQSANKESGSVWAKNANKNQVGDTWAEVYCDAEDDGKGRWIHVQPLLGWMDRPEVVETASIRFAPLTYVVAFSGGGAKDITTRYVSNTQELDKRVLPIQKKWWKDTMAPLRNAEVKATRAYMSAHHNEVVDLLSDSDSGLEIIDSKVLPKSGRAVKSDQPVTGKASGRSRKTKQDSKAVRWDDQLNVDSSAKRKKLSAQKPKDEVSARIDREDEEIKKIAKEHLEIPPNTLEGFKNHKRYVLTRHIPRYCALSPGAQLQGLHKGEAYYLRSDVSELHTAEKWVTNGREVVPVQLINPFKVVAKRGSKAKQKKALMKDAGEFDEGPAEDPEDDANKTKLYGKWQTKVWCPPLALDGIVPKNERGNVHCPPLAPALPMGTTKINRPRIVGVCKRLNVDYAMAMTGFDIRGGRSVPRFEGVVVCEEFADQVLKEWEKDQREAEERKAQKRMDEAVQHWSQTLRAMFLRLSFQEGNPEPKAQPKKQGKKRTKVDDQAGTNSAQAKAKRGKKAAKGQESAAGDALAAEQAEKHARDNAEVEDI